MSRIKSESLLKKLVLIKYLFSTAEELSYQKGTSASFSILAFHDCVEMLLVLIAHHKNKRTQDHFLDYWQIIPELPDKGKMDNLNTVRVSLKHNAIFPSRDEINRCCHDTRSFLTNSIEYFWHIDFDTISLADMIEFPNIKDYVKKAETFLSENNIYESLCNARIGFEELLSTYESDKMQWYRSIFNVGEKIGTGYENIVPRKEKDKVLWFKQVTKTTNAVRDVLKISALGIDYKKYVLFCFITPSYLPTTSPIGERGYYMKPTDTMSTKPEDCRFCIDFVIDSALKLQEFQFSIKDYLKK